MLQLAPLAPLPLAPLLMVMIPLLLLPLLLAPLLLAPLLLAPLLLAPLLRAPLLRAPLLRAPLLLEEALPRVEEPVRPPLVADDDLVRVGIALGAGCSLTSSYTIGLLPAATVDIPMGVTGLSGLMGGLGPTSVWFLVPFLAAWRFLPLDLPSMFVSGDALQLLQLVTPALWAGDFAEVAALLWR